MNKAACLVKLSKSLACERQRDSHGLGIFYCLEGRLRKRQVSSAIRHSCATEKANTRDLAEGVVNQGPERRSAQLLHTPPESALPHSCFSVPCSSPKLSLDPSSATTSSRHWALGRSQRKGAGLSYRLTRRAQDVWLNLRERSGWLRSAVNSTLFCLQSRALQHPLIVKRRDQYS